MGAVFICGPGLRFDGCSTLEGVDETPWKAVIFKGLSHLPGFPILSISHALNVNGCIGV